MFHLTCSIPQNCIIACSGGRDSMALLNFAIQGRKNPSVLYINHKTQHAHIAEQFIIKYCNDNNIPFKIETISLTKKKSESLEEHWRNARYDIFFHQKNIVLTAHQLDDVAEWWIMSSLHGQSKLIPVQNKNVYRPFLKVTREQINDYIHKAGIGYVEDPSNSSMAYTRNFVRAELIQRCLKVNPGLYTTLRKLITKNNNKNK